MTIDASMVKRLANQTTLDLWPGWVHEGRGLLNLIAFANAVAAYEREACAKVCERIGDTVGECPEMAGYCADAVRMRSKGE